MSITRLIFVFAWIGVTGCDAPDTALGQSNDQPSRIVSLDFCADQYVLKLADREKILALSPDATERFSYMRKEARGLRQVRARAEDVLILKPDLVVRTYGGGPNVEAFFARSGIPVLTLGWTGDLDDVKTVIQDTADMLGETERGASVVRDIDERLAALPRRENTPTVLYMTPAGATTGPGSLVDEALSVAGLENFQKKPGWRSLPLERLAYEQPDLVAASFFERQKSYSRNSWSATRHPVARHQIENRTTVSLDGAWTACSGWFLMDAIEALADGAKDLSADPKDDANGK